MKILIEEIERYIITYDKGGYEEEYIISGVIDRPTKDTITCYAFHKGIRTFKIKKIIKIEKIG